MSPLLCGLWILGAGLSRLAAADDRDEDSIFGGGATTPPPPDAPPAAPPADPSAPPAGSDAAGTDSAGSGTAGGTDAGVLDGGRSAPTDASILGRLNEVDDRLAIGGQLYMPVAVSFAKDTAAEDIAWSNPNLLDLYADVRPNDRLRAYARGRFKYDFTLAGVEGTDLYGNEITPAAVALDQLWLKWDIAKRVYVTFGRQRIKWGAGRFWNPTDFLNQQVLDPLAAYDLRTGVGLLKVHVPLEALGGNVYAIANFEGATSPALVGGAVRAEWLVGNTEVSASAAARKDQPVRLGADVSTGIWVFDLHVEGAVQHGITVPYYTGAFDLDTLTVPTATDRSKEWVPQVVAGLELPIRYSDEDSLSVGVEGFYNGYGYPDASLYPYLIFAQDGSYTPFYLGEAYVGAYAYASNPGRLRDQSFTLSYLSNLSDGSMLARADWRATVYRKLALNTYVAGHFGDEGEFNFSFTYPDVITVPPPLVDVGVGLNVPF